MMGLIRHITKIIINFIFLHNGEFNVKKVILTVSLLVPIFLHAMDRREIIRDQADLSCYDQLEQATRQAGKTIQEAATVCCMI